MHSNEFQIWCKPSVAFSLTVGSNWIFFWMERILPLKAIVTKINKHKKIIRFSLLFWIMLMYECSLNALYLCNKTYTLLTTTLFFTHLFMKFWNAFRLKFSTKSFDGGTSSPESKKSLPVSKSCSMSQQQAPTHPLRCLSVCKLPCLGARWLWILGFGLWPPWPSGTSTLGASGSSRILSSATGTRPPPLCAWLSPVWAELLSWEEVGEARVWLWGEEEQFWIWSWVCFSPPRCRRCWACCSRPCRPVTSGSSTLRMIWRVNKHKLLTADWLLFSIYLEWGESMGRSMSILLPYCLSVYLWHTFFLP